MTTSNQTAGLRHTRPWLLAILLVVAPPALAAQGNLGLAAVPAGHGPPPHVHRGEDEIFIIMEGRYEVLIEGRRTEVGPGAIVYLPRGCAHAFRNIGDSVARHWVVNTSSAFERFFEKSAEVFAAPGAPDRTRLLEIAREHEMEFV